MPATIAIVGRPNVGKSRLFNALIGRKVAIVHDQPGVTRDANVAELAAGLNLVDTGGWGLSKAKGTHQENSVLVEAVENQVSIAVQSASAILFVVDGRSGLNALDTQIVRWLRPYRDKVTVVINKIDDDQTAFDQAEISRLGFARSWIVSAEHNRGIDTLKSRLLPLADPLPQPEVIPLSQRRASVCIIGRPNVGKSSLTNALIKSSKMIVSPISGTTRDPVAVDLDFKPQKGSIIHFQLVDTAGLRHRTKVGSPIEVFSQIKTRQALERADVAILVIDAQEGVTKQDRLLADLTIEMGKPLVVAVNKWDLAMKAFEDDNCIDGYETLADFERECRKNITDRLFFVSQTPFVFLSAKESVNLDQLLRATQKFEACQDQQWKTPEINKLFAELLHRNVPRNATGKIFKIYYGTQTGNRPYRVRLFCNQSEGVNDSFRRFLVRGFAEHFGVEGCPIFFDFVSKPKRIRESRPSHTLAPRQKQRLKRHKKS